MPLRRKAPALAAVVVAVAAQLSVAAVAAAAEVAAAQLWAAAVVRQSVQVAVLEVAAPA
ncbi:hypothetical protein [Bradyrhizobium sp. CB3481]|jgi:hypothetical protein|uniref:hypothetical protein n=1 Tax=Bradyrhizobium sp. CB3481 TaxID=3039158 RepID=UPI0032C22E07